MLDTGNSLHCNTIVSPLLLDSGNSLSLYYDDWVNLKSVYLTNLWNFQNKRANSLHKIPIYNSKIGILGGKKKKKQHTKSSALGKCVRRKSVSSRSRSGWRRIWRTTIYPPSVYLRYNKLRISVCQKNVFNWNGVYW